MFHIHGKGIEGSDTEIYTWALTLVEFPSALQQDYDNTAKMSGVV